MSNKLFSMLELSSKGFPHNEFYAIDLSGVMPNEMESFLRDGLRNFRSKVNCKSLTVRTGVASNPEVKLYLATDLDASKDELVIDKMKEALTFLSKRFNGYSNGFIILQKWTLEDEYLYSLNLMPLNNEFIVEAVKGNHFLLDRSEQEITTMKISTNGVEIIKQGLNPDDIILLNRHLTKLINKHSFENNCVYEFSFLKDNTSFYQVKKPGKLYKEVLTKKEFYEKLRENKIPYNGKILRKNN